MKSEFEKGSAYSAGKLGWAYQKGLGVSPDLEKAKELYEHAAHNGMTYWQFLLAHAYEKGYLGYTKNHRQSQYWRTSQPKVHIDIYECWVHKYYLMKIFPPNAEIQKIYKKRCDIAQHKAH